MIRILSQDLGFSSGLGCFFPKIASHLEANSSAGIDSGLGLLPLLIITPDYDKNSQISRHMPQ